MNLANYKYYYDLASHEYSYNKKINLITVLCHELGHSFGLTHVNDEKSIMNPDNMNFEPTKNDMYRLIKILSKNIKGESPGYFNEKNCSGLKAPLELK